MAIIIRRREAITLLGGAAALWPLPGRAQLSTRQQLIAYLAGGKQAVVSDLVNAFRDGLRELGHDEGRNIHIVYRFAEGRQERLPVLAEELVRLNPLVILTGAVDAAVATKNVTISIPIVCPALADAVHLGLIASEARPGGNVTGITPYVAGLPVKQLELAREVVPTAQKIGLIGNMNDPKAPPQRDELLNAGRTLGIQFIVPEVHSPDDISAAMQALAKESVDVVIVLQTTMILSERGPIAALAAANRLPTVFGYRQHVEEGGLISYGVDLRWCFHRAAYYVDKILNGATPRDLPVEFPTKLQMVINLGTSKVLGLTLPPTLLARADEVIE
jgi:putative tryptophan/tyrosine transport system substrate-binding protein